MDPATCPSCGRAWPQGTGARTCPACGHRLPWTAPATSTEPPSWLRDAPPAPGEPDTGADDPAMAAATDPSVRPPTVDREHLPEPDRDPLAGWDRDPDPVAPAVVADWAVVAGAAAAGLVVGVLAAPRGRSVTGAVLGALVGLAGAGIRRSVWRIDPPDGSWARRVTG